MSTRLVAYPPPLGVNVADLRKAYPPEPGYWDRAHWIAIAMLAVIAVRLHELLPYMHLLHPAILVSVGGLGLVLTKTRRDVTLSILHYLPARIILAYIGWMCITIPFAMWQGLAFNTVKAFVPVVLLFIGILLCSPNRQTLYKVQLGFAVAAGIFAAWVLAYGHSRVAGRLSAGVGMYDSNDMSAMMAAAFPMAAGLFLTTKARLRLVAGGAAGLLAIGVVASGSRGGTLGLVAGAVVFVFGMRGSRKITIATLMVAAGALIWTTASPAFRERMLSLTSLENDYNYTDPMGRKAVWERGRSYIKDHPVFGVGAGNFPIAEGARLEEMQEHGKWSTAHNAYIQAYAELGLIGGSLFVAFLVVGGIRAFAYWRSSYHGRPTTMHRPELLASVVTIAVTATFLSQAYFTVLYGVMAIVFLTDRAGMREALTGHSHAPAPLPRSFGQRGGAVYGMRPATPLRRSVQDIDRRLTGS